MNPEQMGIVEPGKIATAVKEAKKRGWVHELRGYCDNNERPCCPARQVTIIVKDHDGLLAPLIRSSGLHCPVCKRPLLFDWARTDLESHEHEAQDARCKVNLQMWARDTGVPFIPVRALVDDRLPPTPADWWGDYERADDAGR